MFRISTHVKGYVDQKVDGTPIPSGFQITFENGNTISVQFGFGNYCSNTYESKPESLTAEIAIWDKDKNWHQFEGDTVKGWVGADKVADWIKFAQSNTIINEVREDI